MQYLKILHNPLIMIVLLVLLLNGCGHNANIREIASTTVPSLTACVPKDQIPQTGKVIKISDGDTITVEIDGLQYRLRYIGIDAPEFNTAEHAQAEQASNYNFWLVDGKEVTLYRDTSETDRFDRLLRYIFIDDVFINYELVRSGMARARNYPPDSSCKDVLKYGERQARKEGLGIWAGE
jgi:micrococcal nuclease